MNLNAIAPTRKGCAVTRLFSSRITDRVEQLIATYTSRCGEKLHRVCLETDHVTVFLHTSEHETAPGRSALQ